MTKKDTRGLLAGFLPMLGVLLFTLFSSLLLFTIRKIGVINVQTSKKSFKTIGVCSTNPYCKPLFDSFLDRKAMIVLM